MARLFTKSDQAQRIEFQDPGIFFRGLRRIWVSHLHVPQEGHSEAKQIALEGS